MNELIISKKEDLTDIADAVREQTGEEELMSLSDIADGIRTLSSNKIDTEMFLTKTEQALSDEEVSQVHQNLKLNDFPTKEEVESLYKTLNSDRVLRFYCVEDVAVVVNGTSKTYPANSNVEVKLLETDVFEIVPTSDNSILALNGFPGALGTYYSWLEGVKQFSNILFDMNNEDFYSKWSQGNQGAYQVQYAQYLNCIFWSDNPYISDVSKRTNYTLYYTSQLPLCYSSIPDNTFKAFYLAFNVNSDPNWGNQAYRDSFAKATWATQVFSYYGARTIGIFGHDDPDFNIILPKDCRGLFCEATAVENAGTFDAINVTNFGAKSGSWRDTFRMCYSLRNLYIKNLKVNLNVSWSPLEYDSIYFIISKAANTNAITISVSPYTYNLLDTTDFELATSKNITIELITTNLIEDKRLSTIANKADKSYVDEKFANIPSEDIATEEYVTSLVETKKDKDIIVTYRDNKQQFATHSVAQILAAVQNGGSVYFQKDAELLQLLEVTQDFATFYIHYLNMNNKVQQKVVAISGDSIMLEQDDTYDYANKSDLNSYYKKPEVDNAIAQAIANKANTSDVLLKAAQTLTDDELTQVRTNLKFIGKSLGGKTVTVDGTDYTASDTAEIFGDYTNNIAVGDWSIAEGSGTVAKGRASHAEGAYSKALQDGCHVEGYQTKATGYWSHAEGEMTVVSSYASHAEGSYCTLPDGVKRYGTAAGYASHIEGGGCHATGSCSHAEGLATTVSGAQSHAEGRYTIATGGAQHVEGTANIEDTEGNYIHIAGNGTFDNRSNAYTLDWNGNGWYAGNLEASAIILRSSTEGSNKKFKVTIDDSGSIQVTELV